MHINVIYTTDVHIMCIILYIHFTRDIYYSYTIYTLYIHYRNNTTDNQAIHIDSPMLLLLQSDALECGSDPRGGVQTYPRKLDPDPAQVVVEVRR